MQLLPRALYLSWFVPLGVFYGDIHSKIGIPIKSSKGGPAFSHLFFADDLVLFAKVNHINCSTIQDVLEAFCARLGQSISESKSRVYFSLNVDTDTRESLCGILGFKSTPNLGIYLGFPLNIKVLAIITST